MNQVIAQPQAERRASPVELYTAQVLGDETASADLFSALPAHIPPERFKRNFVNALMQNPDMLKYEPRLVYREVSKSAALGLLLDPQLGECYIVPVWNGKAGRAEPQLRVGYRGIIKLARQSGEISSIYAHEVHENDEFVCKLGTDKQLVHEPNPFGERGRIVGYYAVAKFKDGDTDFEPMTVEQIHAIREKSDGWRAFKAGKIKSTPWSTDESEMAKKTVIKRLLKRVPQSPDLTTALNLENDAAPIEQARVIDLTQPRQHQRQIQARPIMERLDDFASDAEAPESQEPGPPPTEAPSEAEPGAVTPAPATPEASPAPSAVSFQTTDGAGDAELPASVREAKTKGAAARGSDMPREVPKVYKYVSRQAEADAFLKGWDEEDTRRNLDTYGAAE